MNSISIGLDLLLAVLLIAAFAMGWQVNRRLKALKASQSDFVQAVANLDRSAQAAEAGLTQLRAATDEALDLLGGRIEKARELTAKLERLNAEGEALAKAPLAPPPQAPVLERAWTRPQPSAANAIAAAEALVLKLSREDKRESAPAAEPPTPSRQRPWMDDDLFETPSRPVAGGARGR